jgi:carbon monoxide dehydrogenase subunit G
MAISNSIAVAADPETTFARLADLDNAGDWNTVHVDYPAGEPGPAEAGRSFKEQVSLMGMPAEVEWTIERADAGILAMRGTGPMATTLSATFTVAATDGGGGSTVTYESEFGGASIAAMVGPIEAASKKAGDESLAKLRDLLA